MAQTREAGARKRGRRLLQFLLFAAVLGLVGFGFTTYVLAPAQSSAAIPQYVGALKLVSRVEGQQALTDINKLHGTEITLRNAFIVGYSGPYGASHLMVWVGEAGTPAAAADLINRMVKGITKGASGFSNPRQIKVDGQDVWQADGQGGQFFFYVSREPSDRVVWLSIEGSDSTALLERALQLF